MHAMLEYPPHINPDPNASFILVVEDDGLLRQMLCGVLEGQGWVTEEASNGEQALEMLENFIPRLIILDLMMPVMDGFTFAEKMREKPSFRDVQIIVLTAMILEQADRDRLAPHVQQIIEKGSNLNYMYLLFNHLREMMA